MITTGMDNHKPFLQLRWADGLTRRHTNTTTPTLNDMKEFEGLDVTNVVGKWRSKADQWLDGPPDSIMQQEEKVMMKSAKKPTAAGWVSYMSSRQHRRPMFSSV